MTERCSSGALLLRQLGHGAFQIAQFEAFALVRRPSQHRLGFAQPDRRALAHPTADLVDILIVEDGEQPGPQIGPFLPQMKLPQGTGEAILDKVIGGRDIARQRPGIAPQAGDLGFDTPMNFHENSPLAATDPLGRPEVSGTLRAACNRLMSAPSVLCKKL